MDVPARNIRAVTMAWKEEPKTIEKRIKKHKEKGQLLCVPYVFWWQLEQSKFYYQTLSETCLACCGNVCRRTLLQLWWTILLHNIS